MLLSSLILNCLLCSIVGVRLNLYNTDETLDLNNLQVNCLHHYNGDDPRLFEKIEYCLGPMNNSYSLDDDFLHLHGQYFTFDQLHQMDVSTNDLLLWSSTIDLAEKYQYYLNHTQENSALSTEIFMNCTQPWFGPRCQFSFDRTIIASFSYFVKQTFDKRVFSHSIDGMVIVTCYTDLECKHGDGSKICLDWREICDGRIDCIDGGEDEKECGQLEVNECNENEYRCHNGQCIPKEFLKYSTAECLDESDTLNPTQMTTGYRYIFNSEEHSCRTASEPFVCGDGECVKDFDECDNNRNLLLFDYISMQGHLSYRCWITMICLTKIHHQINETSCHQLLTSSDIHTMLQTCNDHLIQFPTVPVLFGYVRFLYHVKELHEWSNDTVLIPDYICYDHQLCHFLLPTYYHGYYTCRHRDQLDIDWNTKHQTWFSLIHMIQLYFRKCLTTYNNTKNIKNDVDYSSLYCCQNSTKCISKHRILDNVSDCYLNDDEEQDELSCSIDDVQRFICGNRDKCYSFVVPQDICSSSLLRTYDKINFGEFCDRQIHAYPVMTNGQTHTDETDCDYWPCNNYYTRCDGFWSCGDGSDEENCTTQQMCPSHFLPCVIPNNYTLTCLPSNQVNDGDIDCFGEVDEQQHCRNLIDIQYKYKGFRCKNSDICTGPYDLCDGRPQCPDGDDEIFCKNYHHDSLCHYRNASVRTDVENALCLFTDLEKIKFSLETSSMYPIPNSQSMTYINDQSVQQTNIVQSKSSQIDDSTWLWRCHYGFYVRHWLGSNNFTDKCFCPPNYYGDRCQYQKQRISLTIQLRFMSMDTVYGVVIRLIDDNDYHQKIISYQQYTTGGAVTCERIFNTYLTYETQSKTTSTNYSIRVDVYNKTNSVTHVASWSYEVPFSFLPVNRMAIVVYVPFQQVSMFNNCPFTCQHGNCTKYINKNKYYCQCDHSWSGIQCDIPLSRHDCSSDSIYVGMIYNRSICVCPVNKGDPRCLLTLSCDEEMCDNNGTCVVLDDGTNDILVTCICQKGFATNLCQSPAKLEISLDNIQVSPIVLIYTFVMISITSNSQMISSVTVEKLTIFQRTISMYIKNRLNLALVKIDNRYYLAVLRYEYEVVEQNLSTSINSSRQCALMTELFTNDQLQWPEIHRIKYYHQLCQTHLDMICFVDDPYVCLCTLEHHANCFRFNSAPPKCQDQSYCLNKGICLQDVVECPTRLMCNCTDCYFGDRCQFYAKGIGLTLDDIFRYELRPNVTLSNQSSIIISSCILTMIIFVAGLINSILSLITFSTKKSREVGCGLYLIASSITSLLTVSMFTGKFWFLLLTQINPSVRYSILEGGCRSFEFLLRSFLYMDNWFNACVAIERAMTVYKGVSFNKMSSKRIARWIIILLPLLVLSTIVHDPIYRRLYDDKEEQRFWCVFEHSQLIQIYNTIITFLHFLGPFCVNIFSALFIIISTSRRRAITQTRFTYNEHLREELKEHKNLIISPIILVILAIPRLIISISSQCVKVSHNSWLYLIGYLVSFLPSISIFIVFVLPSEFYTEQFKERLKKH